MGADQQNTRRCLVTGATGYIGRALVTALVEAGCSVTATGRQPRGEDWAPCIRFHLGDLEDPFEDWDLDGVDCVFHVGGIAHQQADSVAYARINVDATERLARACASSGVARFVFFSSVKATAYAARPDLETRPPESLTYGASKALAERRLREIVAASAMDLVVLRPALVYSDDAPGHLAWLRRWVTARMPAPPPGGARSMIARDDLVRLCVSVLRRRTGGDPLTITATDGEQYSTERLYRALCDAYGVRALLPSPPVAAWRVAARFVDFIRREVPGSTWERIAGSDLATAAGFDDLGFEPELTFERSLDIVS